jgi:hypothetical protein
MFARPITGHVGVDGSQEMVTNFIYDEARPFEVRLQNVTGADIIFGRELLSEAVRPVADGERAMGYAGEGSISFSVTQLIVGMHLRFDGGYQNVLYPLDEVNLFLDQTRVLVPEGEEVMDIDALLDDFYNDKI